jgi:cytochrome c biogenesis protein CcmG, thiol:disulfide interchange protein DsbE
MTRRMTHRMTRAYAAALGLLLAVACTGAKPASRNSPEPVPQIATDPCPAPSELRTSPAPKGALPDVELRCLGHDGGVRLAALGGVPTVVNLWASWCLPCRQEMPDIERLHQALGTKVRFLGVDTKDFENSARAAIQAAAVTYPSVFDKDERIRRAVGARTLPTTVLVGADGAVKNVHVGQLTEAELRALVTKHLGVS